MAEFEEFFELSYQPVVRSLRLAFGEAVGVEDAVQEAFAQAYVKWGSVGAVERPATWVYVVAIRRLRRQLRRAERSAAQTTPRPADVEDAVVDRIVAAQMLAGLAPRQRATVVLRYLLGWSVEEVASALGCSTGTVKAASHVALAHLRADSQEVRDGA